MWWYLPCIGKATGAGMSHSPLILGIESSCDDSAAAVLRGRDVLSSVVMGQNDLHAEFGGVVPEIAARAHAERLDVCVEQAVAQAGVTLRDLDAIAVTSGPGLIGGVVSGWPRGWPPGWANRWWV